MNHQLIFPLFAMALLVFVVWVKMIYDRVSEIRVKRIHPQKLASANSTASLLSNVKTADNFANLSELPILFYLGSVLAMLGSAKSPLLLPLAWLFVISRYAHSAIHCGTNHVMHRFMSYVFGGAALILFWIVLLLELASA